MSGAQCRAIAAFAPRSTDELAFDLDDVITLTQQPDVGGWWEGIVVGRGSISNRG
jgi:hypothetical protein